MLLSCSLTRNSTSLCNRKQKEMKKFDEDKFNELRGMGEDSYINADSSEVKMIEAKQTYIETEEIANSRVVESRIYFKDTREVQFVGRRFYDAPIGCHIKYDEKGNIISSVDHDAGYKFTIEDLCAKLLKDFKIDLLTTDLPVTVRKEKIETPVYKILIPLEKNMRNGFRIIIIDGETGKVIMDKLNEELEDKE